MAYYHDSLSIYGAPENIRSSADKSYNIGYYVGYSSR